MNQGSSSAPARFDARTAAPFFFRHGHPGWLGLRLSDQGEDWVELELPWREDLLGEPDRPVLASGPIISLMDMASGMAVWQTSGNFVPVATLDLRVDYQRASAEKAAVFGRAQCYRITRSAAFVRGVAHDGDRDDPVATIAGVFMTLGGDPRSAQLASGRAQINAAGTGDA
jgi:uncharacterized protein (TIGR00369 family)